MSATNSHRRARRLRAVPINNYSYYPVNFSERTIINDPKGSMGAYDSTYGRWTEFVRCPGMWLNFARMGHLRDFRVVEKRT